MRAEQCKKGTRFIYVGGTRDFKGHIGTIAETYDKTKTSYVKVIFDEVVLGKREWATTTREIKLYDIPTLCSYEDFLEGRLA